VVADTPVASITVTKPKLRGWLHAGMFPVSLAAGIVLVAGAPPGEARIAAAIFSLASVLLFGTSALFHRGNWSLRVKGVLRRMDHSNIFLIIAGSYTPFAMLGLPEDQGRLLLTIVWSGALLGVLFRIFWIRAPRWLYTTLYLVVGWVAVFFLPELIDGVGVAVVVLIIVGGCLYTLGALVYGLKWPNPWHGWFGFHEVFHAFTIAAFTVHYIAVSMVVYS
jgi:hemolysin III